MTTPPVSRLVAASPPEYECRGVGVAVGVGMGMGVGALAGIGLGCQTRQGSLNNRGASDLLLPRQRRR